MDASTFGIVLARSIINLRTTKELASMTTKAIAVSASAMPARRHPLDNLDLRGNDTLPCPDSVVIRISNRC
jgi:hypothetical protein